MAVKDQATLITEITARINDNVANEISEADVREPMIDIVDTFFDLSESQSGTFDVTLNDLDGPTILFLGGFVNGIWRINRFDGSIWQTADGSDGNLAANWPNRETLTYV